jgi:hypothetical protein
MKAILVLLWLLSVAPWDACAQRYRHRSEAEIARMMPAQRVEEYAEEDVRHRYDVLDEYSDLIAKYIRRDGLAALSRMIEIMDEYDPTRASGRRAMDALERAIGRMRAAGYGQPDQHEWEQHGRFESAVAELEEARGINGADRAIKNALWLGYRVQMSDEELLAFSNFLVARDPTYPRWSEMDYVQDPTRLNAAGVPVRMHTMRTPQRYYEAYLEFRRRQP